MMPPLADTHCHLLAGLDDGPRTPEDAIAMCKKAYAQGVRYSVALAHQNDEYPLNTPDRIREAFGRLEADLRAADLPYNVVVCSEVMVSPDMLDAYDRGELLTVGGHGKYILLEMPHGLCVELGWIVERFVAKGVRPILAHAERSPELLEDTEAVEKLIRQGCIIQVSTRSITHPSSSSEARTLKDWFRRGVAHVLGSDGHSLRRRPPDMADAYRVVRGWAGQPTADRVASIFGLAVLHGLPLKLPAVEPPRSWLRFW